MVPSHNDRRLPVRIAIALLLISTPTAMADEPPDARLIRGKAFIAGGDRPAAGVTLHFFDRHSPDLTAVTDAGGRFRSALPARFMPGVIRDGQSGPPCWVEVHDADHWTWEPIHFAPIQQAEGARKNLTDLLLKPAQTIWRERAGLVNLEVECPPTGEVEVLVRGAGGAPVVNRPVQVIPAWRRGSSRDGGPSGSMAGPTARGGSACVGPKGRGG